MYFLTRGGCMNKNLFSGLEDLGFDNTEKVDIYAKEDENNDNANQKSPEETEEEKIKSALYDREITCPVCGNVFKARAVKSGSIRRLKSDSDFFKRYQGVNPYFYDVWICNSCGYTNMESDFLKLREAQKDLIKQKITPKWHGKSYPEAYDVNIAIERFKLCLYNACVYGASSSKKATICLKTAWMYRLLRDSENEKLFLSQAIEGFNDAFMNENVHNPGAFMYLIGELNRRIGNDDESLQWFSKLITTRGVDQKLKDLARDQKDLIMDSKNETSVEDIDINDTDDTNNEEPAKKGFFSKLFK